MFLQNLPSEILELILFTLKYNDIINYCESYPGFIPLNTNDMFWKRKLKHTFSMLGDNHILNPTKYALKYRNHNEYWSKTYKRWELTLNVNNSDTISKGTAPIYDLTQNLDIIMFYLNIERNRLYKPILLKLYKIAIKYNNLYILNKIDSLNFNLFDPNQPLEYDPHIWNKNINFLKHIGIKSSNIIYIMRYHENTNPYKVNFNTLLNIMMYSHINTVQYLYNVYTQRNQREEMMIFAVCKARIDIMTWLFEQGIRINQYTFTCAIHYNQIASLQWILDQGFIPIPNNQLIYEQLYRKQQNPETIQWLIDHSIISKFGLHISRAVLNVQHTVQQIFNTE